MTSHSDTYILKYPVRDYLTLAESVLIHLKQADEFWMNHQETQ
jgi:hypothetical protein